MELVLKINIRISNIKPINILIFSKNDTLNLVITITWVLYILFSNGLGVNNVLSQSYLAQFLQSGLLNLLNISNILNWSKIKVVMSEKLIIQLQIVIN